MSDFPVLTNLQQKRKSTKESEEDQIQVQSRPTQPFPSSSLAP